VDNNADSLGSAKVFIINMMGTEDDLPGLVEGTQLPVLQDNADHRLVQCFGASKWYIYVVDREGDVRFLHYQLDLVTERDRLLAEVTSLQGAKK